MILIENKVLDLMWIEPWKGIFYVKFSWTAKIRFCETINIKGTNLIHIMGIKYFSTYGSGIDPKIDEIKVSLSS